MAEWSTIASLATAGGTLVLAAATFSSVRAGQRSARIAERSTAIAERGLLLGLRPVLAPARVTDPAETVRFAEGLMVTVEAGMAAIERDGESYLFVIPPAQRRQRPRGASGLALCGESAGARHAPRRTRRAPPADA